MKTPTKLFALLRRATALRVGGCLLPFALALSALAQGTAFTYQGRLNASGSNYSGNAEFQATLWPVASGGVAVATNSPASVILSVTNGLVVLPLDFGANFPGANRWVQLEVRTNIASFTVLNPRQPLTPRLTPSPPSPPAISPGHCPPPS